MDEPSPDTPERTPVTSEDLGKLLDAVDAGERLFHAIKPRDALKLGVRNEHRALGEMLIRLHSDG